MTAVVTGAAGFLGRALVRRLLDAGAPVVGIDRRPQGPRPGLTPILADLLDNDPAASEAFAQADVVFHLAGCPGVRDTTADVAVRRYRDNVLATALVLSAVPLPTPLVVASSSAVYGGTIGGRANRETDAVRPRGGYADSKVLVERLCRGRIEAGGLTTIVRPFTVVGEGQRPDMALARWIRAARAGRPLRLHGSPLRTRDLTDVRDVARALAELGERRFCGVVNVGTGAGHTLASMVEAVAAELSVEVETVVEPASPVEAEDTLADTSRLRSLLGWVPETDLRDVVRRQVAAERPATGPTMVRPVGAGVGG